MSSPQWKLGASEPVNSVGTGEGARSEMQAVYGRFRARPRVAKGVSESPRPCSRRRMFSAGWLEGGGMMERWMEGGKSDFVGRQGRAWDGMAILGGALLCHDGDGKRNVYIIIEVGMST